VPAELAGVIARCLEKNAASRYPSMGEVHKALEHGTGPASSAAGGPSIAVLPFTNLSADPDSEFFGDGLAEEILNALAQVDGLRVAARSSSFSFKGQKMDVGEIAAKLRVANVLDGSVRRAGSRVRVTLQLIDAASGFQSWSERYDRDMADIVDVQDEIARAVAARLKVTLAGGSSQRLAKQLTTNVEAYELYLRGRALITKRGKHVVPGGVPETRRRARPRVCSRMGRTRGRIYHTVQGYWGMSPPGEVMPKALTAARRAVALDPQLGEGHCAPGAALMSWEHDHEGARREFESGLALNPVRLRRDDAGVRARHRGRDRGRAAVRASGYRTRPARAGDGDLRPVVSEHAAPAGRSPVRGRAAAAGVAAVLNQFAGAGGGWIPLAAISC
jgi:TolB-like protein